MARPRRPEEPSTYQPQPEIPPELRRRFDLIRAVMGEQMTITAAASELGIARVNMQSLVHRVEAAMLTALQPKPTGPTPRSTTEKDLEARVKQLSKENEKLKVQLQAADEMMMAAGEIIRALRGLEPESSRSSSGRSKRRPKSPSSDDDPERAALKETLCRVAKRLETRSDASRRATRMLGLGSRTLRRWLGRLIAGAPLLARRGGTRRQGPPQSEARVRELVETLHGLAGASSLARSVDGVSRRRAAEIKAEVLTEHERLRKDATARVEVTRPGVVRGFDAMYLPIGYALIAADAAVPFRTSARYVWAYDAAEVAALLDEDFLQHGAPLVLRQDRARCHTAGLVLSVLRKHSVLLLQGPAYHARYYGQLERQNLEHRWWYEWRAGVTRVDQAALDAMKNALNREWRRPRLGWRTAAQCWEARGALDDDRDALRNEVEQRAARLCAHGVRSDLATRLAIEQALTAKGYLRVTAGQRRYANS